MAKGYIYEIRKRILAANEGSIFAASDFADIADTNTVRSALHRLVQEGVLRRILNGIFEKPKYSKLLGEYVAADPEVVAKALDRSYHWTIAPCGNRALNLLGLSSEEAMAAVKELAQKAVKLEDVVIDLFRARDLIQAAQEYQEYKS